MVKQTKNNPLRQLGTLGQSVWLDYIRRDLVTSGELRRLIDKDGLRGMTSNPSIFEEAIVGSHDYDDDVRARMGRRENAKTIYEALSQADVQSAADAFRTLYEKLDGSDGYVSLEVNPHLAHNTEGTLKEARRFWARSTVLMSSLRFPRRRRDSQLSSNSSARELMST